MASKNKTARPAARKQSMTRPVSKSKKTVATRSATKREPIAQVVEREQPRVIVEPPKKTGELPVPTATFYF